MLPFRLDIQSGWEWDKIKAQVIICPFGNGLESVIQYLKKNCMKKKFLAQAFLPVHYTHESLQLCDFLWQEAQAYADDNSLLFMETSAKTAMNVNDLFMAIGMWCSPNASLRHSCGPLPGCTDSVQTLGDSVREWTPCCIIMSPLWNWSLSYLPHEHKQCCTAHFWMIISLSRAATCCLFSSIVPPQSCEGLYQLLWPKVTELSFS